METPSSLRRITRSQAKASISNRSALFDITNDSPIVGLAIGKIKRGETPSSLVSKKKMKKLSPGSGEALLRDQVKILLQKEDHEDSPQEIHRQDSMLSDESEKSDVTRDLFFDFLEKSECSSGLDDASSVWSMQVNTSTLDEDEEEEYYSEGYGEIEDEEEEEGGLVVDELCDGLSKMYVEKKAVPEFEGKHIRFVYNSDGEIEGEEEVVDGISDGVLCLKGMPTPQGKHLHFPEDDENSP